MKRFLLNIFLPWLITFVALYFAFRDIDFTILVNHIGGADTKYLWLALVLTFISYVVRAYRWQFFFIKCQMRYFDSLRVLLLGFFMNNILPARAGELVRAHLGSKISGETRTLVLASVASERLADGLTISLMFVFFCVGMGNAEMSRNLLYVSLAFGLAALLVLLMLFFRKHVFAILDKLNTKYSNRASTYTYDRIKIFVNGLSPLFMPAKLPYITVISVIIWSIELAVYYSISEAFHSALSLPLCVLFLVSVNFSSLIPAAPGGIGVIEAIASAVLVSVGVEREHALTMVLTQHAIQYLVVGIPGAMVMLTWKRNVKEIGEVAPE